jgi:hypothetical protein
MRTQRLEAAVSAGFAAIEQRPRVGVAAAWVIAMRCRSARTRVADLLDGSHPASASAAEFTSLGSRRLAALAAPAGPRRACGLAAVPGAPAGRQHTPSHNTPNDVDQQQSPTAVPLSAGQSPASTPRVKGAYGVTT